MIDSFAPNILPVVVASGVTVADGMDTWVFALAGAGYPGQMAHNLAWVAFAEALPSRMCALRSDCCSFSAHCRLHSTKAIVATEVLATGARWPGL